MPELPEVETIVRRLKSELVGEVIVGFEVRRKKSFEGDREKATDCLIVDVTRRAKMILIKLDKNNLLIHLKMTGQLILIDKDKRLGGGHPSADWTRDLPSSHSRVVITFKSGKVLFFNDQRVFGWIRLLDSQAVRQEFAKYAPDVIDAQITPQYMFEKMQKRSIAVKQVLLDSSVVAGVGNIYACDGLFLAGINPSKPAKDLNLTQVKKLLTSVKTVIHKGIKLGGATIDTYRDIDGLAGGYQNVVLVYGKEDQACPKCGAKIIRFKQGGRSTFWCKNCQK